MTPELNVQVNPVDGFVTLHEMTSKGQDWKAEPSIKLAGVLAAPYQFLIGKRDLFTDTSIHLLINKSLGTLHLRLGDNDAYRTHEISGSLTKDSTLAQFKINTDYRWTVNELIKFLRTMRYYFSDSDDHKKMVESLQKWTAKVETVIKNHQDTSGNSLVMLEKRVGEIELIRSFNLTIPIFQGYEKKKFRVEIGFDPKNTSVDLYLISDELFELEIQFREQLIDAEVARFDEYKFSKVIVS